jgi:hypothetical protein
MGYKLTYENFLYLVLGLISILIIYKLITLDTKNKDISNTEEGFQSIINKFANSKSKKSKSSFTDVKSKSKSKSSSGKGKLSFDDIVKEAEDMDPSRYTVDSLKNDFFNYLGSFQKAKFKNVTGTTDEALEKFGFFKDKFFEIFK